ncbi:MAG: DUF1552 domain-containing protein [Planctomycetota bacterium]
MFPTSFLFLTEDIGSVRPALLAQPAPAMKKYQRRCWLRSTGFSLALPTLASTPSLRADEQPVPNDADGRESGPAKRLVCIGSNLGLHRPALYPADDGHQYVATPLLKPLQQHRDDLTLFSGLDHRAGNGHNRWDNYLCGRVIGSPSLDQMVAGHIGDSTRFESIQLCAGDIPPQRMVYSRQGVPLPMTNRPSVVFGNLFTTGAQKERREYLLRSGRTSLDLVAEQARDLSRSLNADDRQKLDLYLQSVRELESRIGRQLNHLASDDAEVQYELPPYDPVAPTMVLECEQIMLDLISLALQTDSTRVATLFIAGLGQVFTLDGQTLRAGYHALSHHGNDPDLINDLVRVESEHMKCLSRFLTSLRNATDIDGRPLLDSTVVMFGTGMGDASRHSNRDLPTLVAGGGLRHGTHHRFDPGDDSRLLGDVFISIMRQFGMPSNRFSDATRGIDDWA